MGNTKLQNIKAVIFDYGRTLYDRENDRFFPEVRELLEYLHPKYKLAIVSIAKENLQAEERLKALKSSGSKSTPISSLASLTHA